MEKIRQPVDKATYYMHTRLQGKRCSLQKYVVVDRPNSFSDTENSKKCILKYIISYYLPQT